METRLFKHHIVQNGRSNLCGRLILRYFGFTPRFSEYLQANLGPVSLPKTFLSTSLIGIPRSVSLNMPFVIRPPLNSTAADDPSLIFTVVEPEPYERLILRDLKARYWRITRHGFGDDEFIDALKQIEKDIKKRRRQTHAIGGELYGYNARRTLEQIWELEAERMLNKEAYEEPQDPRKKSSCRERRGRNPKPRD
jgi:hypothetical protein